MGGFCRASPSVRPVWSNISMEGSSVVAHTLVPEQSALPDRVLRPLQLSGLKLPVCALGSTAGACRRLRRALWGLVL